MSRAKARAGQEHQSWAPLLLVGGLGGSIIAAWVALAAGTRLAGASQHVPANPFRAVLELATGHLFWPWASWLVLTAVAAAIAGLVALVLRLRLAGTSVAVHQIDRHARYMANRRELSGITDRDARTKAARLAPTMTLTGDRDTWGYDMGTMVAGGHHLLASYEDVITVFAGPRTGKTACLAVPRTITAPGPVITTMNKGDFHALTRGIREAKGQVWVVDLQAIAIDTATVMTPRRAPDQLVGQVTGVAWWWNPLNGVTTIKSAIRLARFFISAAKQEGQRVDSYFDGGAGDLLAQMILAAACSGGDLLHVYGWLAEPDNQLPELLLGEHGHPIPSGAVERTRKINPRQRDGLYDMARRFIAVVVETSYAQFVLPPIRHEYTGYKHADSRIGSAAVDTGDPDKIEFIPEDFAAATDTLYALSKEGADSASSLMTALVGCVMQAAIERARRSPGGRLPIPMLAVLDEAANICKLDELPGWYSHFGSQGINIMTFLQSREQAAGVWSERQVKQLISASNVVYYGGGVNDPSYLQELSEFIGHRDVARWSRSTGAGGWGANVNRSQSWSREPIFTVADLRNLPPDRAIVMFSGNPPLLVKKTHWEHLPYAGEIHCSTSVYDTTTHRRSERDGAFARALP